MGYIITWLTGISVHGLYVVLMMMFDLVDNHHIKLLSGGLLVNQSIG